MPPAATYLAENFRAVLLGTAVGDSLGLPAEGLSPETIRRRWRGHWKQRFFLGHGMCSDDTEHTILVAQSLIAQHDDPTAFQRILARKLRWWLAALPAGVGLATARSIVKLWLGASPKRSGVFSAGNGPAMRSAIIGAYFADDANRRREFVRASTTLTHTDTKAFTAAWAIAEIAATLCLKKTTDVNPVAILRPLDDSTGWQSILDHITQAHDVGEPVDCLVRRLGINAKRGVSGYAWHTVPIAIYAWWRHRGDFQATLESVLNCGGDTDTVGAITGALAALDTGTKGIPHEWLSGIVEWPRSINWMRRMGCLLAIARLAPEKTVIRPLSVAWPLLLPRNLLFLLIVLLHGIRRLVPW